jgi:hypothetical protein
MLSDTVKKEERGKKEKQKKKNKETGNACHRVPKHAPSPSGAKHKLARRPR